MKKNILTMIICGSILMSCSSSKKAANRMNDTAKLNGTWELNYITGPRIAFDVLYPEKKPAITINVAENRVSGNTGCNSFSGPLKIDGNKISFTDPMAMTKMMCQGDGEPVFLQTLQKINTWAVSGDSTLTLMMGDIAMMRFIKK